MAISPHKRLKILTSFSDPILQSPQSYISKGKSKVEEGTSLLVVDNESTDHCGICLSEAGNGEVSRGFIDSCNHYYCFVCIMEWAKVESKCPLCKRRFSTIRRPPKPPLFTSERVVSVPVRDQVYHGYGNATVGPPDPYSEVRCVVCQDIADETLLLLCDLCDSAAHTYCIGLGVTVPEGDWYCQDCTFLRDEHLKSESDTYSVRHISTNEHVTVSDIVRESFGHGIHRSRSASSNPCSLPPPTSSVDETTMINDINQSSSPSLELVAQHPTKPNTRTLHYCRNIHDRIHVLRENWNGFRSGILCFSSSQGDGNNIFSQKPLTSKSAQPSVSRLNQQSIAQHCSSDITNDIGTDEIQKAWKMMDKAKSIKREHQKSGIVRQVSKRPIIKLNNVKKADYMNQRHLPSDSQQSGSPNVGNILPGQHLSSSLKKDFYEQPSSVSGRGKGKGHVVKDVSSRSKASTSGQFPVHKELTLSKGVLTPSCMYDASVRSEKLPAEKTSNEPDCSSPAAESKPVMNINQVKGINHASSSHSKERYSKETRKLEKIHVDSQHYNDAKSEIQLLVKLNLKLQTKEEKLEVNAFKEVARVATHSILAACGLEHPWPGWCAVPGFVCPHPNSIRQLHKSRLLPNSCRECFYVFVKYVVNNVILQKKRTRKNL